MASRQEKRCNLITVTVLFNELKASGSDLRFVYYFVVEWQNGAEGARERGWMFLLWKPSTALAVVFLICTLLGAHLYFHPFPLRECYSAWQNEREEGGVWETPWQVGRHKDNTLLIIDGGKIALIGCLAGQHLVHVNTNVCVCLYICVCRRTKKTKQNPKQCWEKTALSKRNGEGLGWKCWVRSR